MFLFCSQAISENLAIRQDFDIVAPGEDRFDGFLWSIAIVPATWLIACCVGWFEFSHRKRGWLLASLLASPFLVAAAYWFAWGTYIKSIYEYALS